MNLHITDLIAVCINVFLFMELCILESFSAEPTGQVGVDYVPRIVNGRPAALGDVPYQVSFKILVSRVSLVYSSFCGGAIIARSKILSAAHCFDARSSGCCSKSITVSGRKLSRKMAVAGNLGNTVRYQGHNTSGQWRALKVAYYPARYKFPQHDICVLMTKQPFYFNSHVNLIPMASRYIDYKGECLASGYGRTTPTFSNNKKSSEHLLLANLAIVSTYWCSRKHRRNMRTFVCTSDLVSDVSKGDSGGPLVCYNTNDPRDTGKGILVGIVSGNRQHAGSFFTRVSSYSTYIRTNKATTISGITNVFIYTLIYYQLYLF